MVSVNKSVTGENLPCTIQLDGYLKSVLEDSHALTIADFDSIAMVTGEEGAGKTCLTMQCCLFLDHRFSNKNICFNAAGFEEMIKDLPPGSTILWDEADDIGSNWASTMLITLKKTFKRIRKNNYTIFLVTPTFHDLNKYFAIHRTRYLINVYAEFTSRGYFRFYNRKAKKMLYINGKKEMNMQAHRSTFYGSFKNYPKGFPVDFDKYEKDKDEATLKAIGEVTSKADIRNDIFKQVYDFLAEKNIKITKKKMGEILGVSHTSVGRYYDKWELER